MLRRILPALLISKTFFATLLKTLNETGPRLQSVELNIWPGHNIPNRPPIVMSANAGLPPRRHGHVFSSRVFAPARRLSRRYRFPDGLGRKAWFIPL